MTSEDILSIAIPAIMTFLMGLIPSIVPKLRDRKYAPIISAALKALSPILAGNTKYFGCYGVRRLVAETIAAIGNNLTPTEISEATQLALKKFDPAIAASKPDNPASLAIAQEIAKTEGDISKLDLSRIRWNFSIGNN